MISNLNVCIMHMVDNFIQSNLQVGEVSLGGPCGNQTQLESSTKRYIV